MNKLLLCESNIKEGAHINRAPPLICKELGISLPILEALVLGSLFWNRRH